MNTSLGQILNKGKAFVYGDDINTDVLAPGAYLKYSPEVMSKHCLESIDPDFVKKVKPGDIVVGGKNFGVGSSREQAAASLVILGVRYVVAKSFARIFYRNAFNLGLTPLICENYKKIRNQDILEINSKKGKINNLTQKCVYNTNSVPDHLLKIVNAGGLLAELKNKIESNSIKTLRFRKDN
ncbi:MAG: 2,3-dimethylmalate dehydratase small subunit [Alphaproteobacteria bacterium MarineAlpha2_Bin1]|nr:MAG: 2,3-dimethylmalate dehydratase small subunit [Alphaproteobacteria bacterium MarineAlpha2_Bin1]|tara:strand:- start:304 stop:849 length:546 start_codon:yes stop_codon:yes gene_type:complete